MEENINLPESGHCSRQQLLNPLNPWLQTLKSKGIREAFKCYSTWLHRIGHPGSGRNLFDSLGVSKFYQKLEIVLKL